MRRQRKRNGESTRIGSVPQPGAPAAETKKRPTEVDRFICAPEGIRTPNLLIRSQMLYPLSYGRSDDLRIETLEDNLETITVI